MRFALIVGALLSAGSALAAPRVGVVIVAREGLTEEAADEIASSLAIGIATQIEGEAIAGSSVRDRLPAGAPSEGCEEQPGCGRDLAKTLGTDEVLLLNMHMAGKTTVVTCHRVPRDPGKEAKDRTLRLLGAKAKRTQAIMELVTGLFPAGSVEPWVEPAPKKVAKKKGGGEVPTDGGELTKAPPKDEEEGSPAVRPKWLWPAVGLGAGVIVVAAVVAIVIAALTPGSPTGPAVVLP
jgi:hypothetical protein